MSETPSAAPETTQDSGPAAQAVSASEGVDHGFDFSDRYQEVVG
jgi:hypothetical protein